MIERRNRGYEQKAKRAAEKDWVRDKAEMSERRRMRGGCPKENNNGPRESNIPERDCLGGNTLKRMLPSPGTTSEVQFQRRGTSSAFPRMQV